MIEILLIELGLVFLFMAILWAFATKWNNVGLVDIGWTLSFSICAFVGYILGQGNLSKKIVLVLMILAWSFRLAYYLIQRFDKTVEDARYTLIKNNFGKNFIHLKMLGMFFFQGAIVIILSLPFAILFSFAESAWTMVEIGGVIIWAIGLIGESIADGQMAHFKRVNKGSSKVCNIGLWQYSRHPNYFFEWVIWIGFGLFILPTVYGWISIFSVAFMFYLLRYYSGVPPSEVQALKTKGAAYKEYQKHTSIFFPSYPKD